MKQARTPQDVRRAILWCVSALFALACAVAPNSGAQAAIVPVFAERVAMRCKGEASWAIAPCACVVKNRLLAGWDESNVLTPFFAADAAASATEIDLVNRVLTGYWPCDPRLHFMFSSADVEALGLTSADALLIASRGSWTVLFYEKDALHE